MGSEEGRFFFFFFQILTAYVDGINSVVTSRVGVVIVVVVVCYC